MAALIGRKWLPGLLVIAAWTAAGCGQSGPDWLRDGRTHYNEAVRQTSDQELLLNIVRLRYRETPSLLQVNSIAVQMFRKQNGEARINFLPSTADGYNLIGEVELSERPTISYRPVIGQAFVQQMLRPVSESNLVLLYNAGWPVDTLFGLTVQSINGVDNAPGAPEPEDREAGPTDAEPGAEGGVGLGAVSPAELDSEFSQFHELTQDLRVLQRAGRLALGARPGGGLTQARIDRGGDTAEAAQRVLETLRLEAKAPLFSIGQATEAGTDNRRSIAVVTRSLMSTLFFLSQGVRVPEEDIFTGRVPTLRDDDGRPLEQGLETRGLFTVRTSNRRPAEAYAAVRHRGRWFYIHDTDLQSKTTFSLLSQLFAMQSGELKNAGPMLTLPVGGG